MGVSIEDIKALRDSTGVSMTACKKALEEANGDFDAAVDILRKKGEAKAADRAVRKTAEGVVAVESANGKTAMINLQCETDFVSRGDQFMELAKELVGKLLGGTEVGNDLEEVKEAGLKLGENIQVKETAVLDGGVIGSYVHSNNKIGVLVQLDGGSEELARDIAMHAAATAPAVVSPEEVSDELVEKEKSIWKEQLAAEGKPAEIMDKIMMGKEKKFREENALIMQPFVKNPDQTVNDLLNAAGAKVTKFVRFSI